MGTGGDSVSVTLFVIPPNDAVIVTGVDVVTAVVDTMNEALVAPAGTITLAGVEAAALLLDSVTAAPPDGAALVSVTVPPVSLPPVTAGVFNVNVDNPGGSTVINTFFVAGL